MLKFLQLLEYCPNSDTKIRQSDRSADGLQDNAYSATLRCRKFLLHQLNFAANALLYLHNKYTGDNTAVESTQDVVEFRAVGDTIPALLEGYLHFSF